MHGLRIRAATDRFARLTEIYNHYVITRRSHLTLKPYTVERRVAWFEQFGPSAPSPVGGRDDTNVTGYAAQRDFAPRRHYETTVETTIYCAPDATGSELAPALFRAF